MNDVYYNQLFKSRGGSKKDHQPSVRQHADQHKRAILNGTFPIRLTDGQTEYRIVLNSHCDVIFEHGTGEEKKTMYYSDVTNEFIRKLKMIEDDKAL